jgi:hypothetical protein
MDIKTAAILTLVLLASVWFGTQAAIAAFGVYPVAAVGIPIAGVLLARAGWIK